MLLVSREYQCGVTHPRAVGIVFCEVYAGPLSVLMVWGIPKATKADHHCEMVSKFLSPVCAEVHIADEKVLVDTCTSFKHPN